MLSTQKERILKRDTELAALEFFADNKPPMLKNLRSLIDGRMKAIYEAHRAGASGYVVCHAISDVIDMVVQRLHAAFVEKRAKFGNFSEHNFCIVALGGYGRRELCPKSDIDIMFLYSNDKVSDVFKTQAIEEIMYPLWNVGYKLGHSSRTVAEAIEDANADILTKTAMLDARFLCGSKQLFESYQNSFSECVKSTASEHIEELLRLKTARHRKYGWTPYVQEPSVKNGVGGLRDYQTLLWVSRLKIGAKTLMEMARAKVISVVEYKTLRRSYNLLLRVRNEMHYLLNRENDLLDLETQPRVAKGLGYEQKNIVERVEKFMHNVYYALREIDSISKTARKRMRILLPEDINEALGLRFDEFSKVRYIEGFIIKKGFMYAQNPNVFRRDPTLLIKVFRCCQKFGARLSDELEILIRDCAHLVDDKVRNDKTANSEFMKILRSPLDVFPILSKMHFLDILGKFIPDFGAITCLVQHEFYHRYTADIHTLATIYELDKIFNANVEDDPYGYYHAVLSDTKNSTILYLALLMHDLGKSDGIRGHAEVGAEIAARILKRFDVTEDDKETIIFLVRNHFMMSRYWQSNDIEDEGAIQKFAKMVGDVDRLKYLYVLTFCDANGVSGGLWSSYKQSLHTMLYRNALRALQKNEQQMEAYYEAKKQSVLESVLQSEDLAISVDEAKRQFELFPRNYFLFHGLEDIVLHLNMVHSYKENLLRKEEPIMPIFEWRNDPNMSLSTVTVVTSDIVGFYYKLASAFTYAGLNILGSKAISRSDGIVIDTFYVTAVGGGAVQNERTRELFAKAITQIIATGKEIEPPARKQDLHPGEIIPHHYKLLPAPDRLIMEVIAKDRPGLLYSIAKAINKEGYDIIFARISVEDSWGTNTFHLRKSSGPANEISLTLQKSVLEAL